MFKSGSIENELMQSMEKNLASNYLENKHNFNKLAKAFDYINAAADIFDKSGMKKESEEITSFLNKLAEEVWEDEIPGGLADKKTPKDFDPKSLEKGMKVELEHTNNHHMAKEIAMDHLTEDPKYYEKLEKMEKGS